MNSTRRGSTWGFAWRLGAVSAPAALLVLNGYIAAEGLLLSVGSGEPCPWHEYAMVMVFTVPYSVVLGLLSGCLYGWVLRRAGSDAGRVARRGWAYARALLVWPMALSLVTAPVPSEPMPAVAVFVVQYLFFALPVLPAFYFGMLMIGPDSRRDGGDLPRRPVDDVDELV